MTTIFFGSSGTYSPWNAGVAMYLLERMPIDHFNRVFTVSGGALGLALFVFDNPSELYQRMVGTCRIMSELKELKFKAPFQVAEICRRGLNYFFPDNVHLLLGDKVSIGVTQFPSFHPVELRGPFPSKAALIDALLASSFIPLFFFRGYYEGLKGYIDGGFSQFPLDPATTLFISVTQRKESDIFHDHSFFPHLRFQSFERYMELFWLGYRDASKNYEKVVAKLNLV